VARREHARRRAACGAYNRHRTAKGGDGMAKGTGMRKEKKKPKKEKK
jgi:hypothetical protein